MYCADTLNEWTLQSGSRCFAKARGKMEAIVDDDVMTTMVDDDSWQTSWKFAIGLNVNHAPMLKKWISGYLNNRNPFCCTIVRKGGF